MVTPFAGVWIEISLYPVTNCMHHVTPFAGVWIEIRAEFANIRDWHGHSLRGSVD